MSDDDLWDIALRLRRIAGSERETLAKLAATIAAGIEANAGNQPSDIGDPWTGSEAEVAKRAVRIACEIVKAVAP